MKKITSALLLIVSLLFASSAIAAPYAVTAKFATGIVTDCIFSLNSGASVTLVPVSVDATNSVCKYDVGSVSEGSNVVTVAYGNMWGNSTAVPFTFVKALPPTPSGTHLEK